MLISSVLDNFWAVWTSETKPDPSEALFYRSGNSQRLFPEIKNEYGAVAAGKTAQKLSSTEAHLQRFTVAQK